MYTDAARNPRDRNRQKQPEEEWDRSGMTTVSLIHR